MRMTKTVNYRIREVIATAAIPTFEARVGAELHHSKRNGCARIGVSVTARADEWIDEIGQAIGRFRLTRKKKDSKGKKDYR